MESFNTIFDELKSTNPQQLIANNRNLEKQFSSGLSFVQQIADLAQRLLNEFFAERQDAFQDTVPAAPAFPIPVRDIAKRCNFMIYETEIVERDAAKREAQGGGGRTDGGRATIAQMQMRERKRYTLEKNVFHAKPEIAGTIIIDKNLSEYAKRFAIAHELGHYVLRTLNPVGPLYVEDACPGPFAYVPVKEFLANEFAYALLLPYDLVKERKKRYETENKYTPLSYMDWIQVLEDEAQVPQHYVILAYEEIKRRQLAEMEMSRQAALKALERGALESDFSEDQEQ